MQQRPLTLRSADWPVTSKMTLALIAKDIVESSSYFESLASVRANKRPLFSSGIVSQAAEVSRQKRIIPILVGRGAKTEGKLKRARNGLAGAYEEFFHRQCNQEIVELLQTLGVEE